MGCIVHLLAGGSNTSQISFYRDWTYSKMSSSISNKSNGKGKKGNLRGPSIAAAVAYSAKQGFPLGQNRSRRVQNSELVATVAGSVAFASVAYPLNPGLAGTFPWLSEIAGQWQQYRFHKLCFRYVTRTATSTVGSVVLSPDYNPNDPPPTTEAQASNTQDAVEDVTWKDLVCKLDPSAMFPFGPRKQIRRSLVAADESVYDAGTMFLCTLEETGTSAIGKLWVDYDVELFVPQNSPNTDTLPLICSCFNSAGDQTFVTATPATVLLATEQYNPLGIVNATSVFTPLAGVYKVTAQAGTTDSAAELVTCSLEILKNSVSAALAQFALTFPAGGYFPIQVSGVLALNGTDTVTVRGFMQGAAGTLKMIPGTKSTWIRFELV